MTTFAQNLQTAINIAGISQRELSRKAGITTGMLNCYIKGRSGNPRYTIIKKLCDALGVDPNYLMGWGSMVTDSVENRIIVQKIAALVKNRTVS